MYDLLDYLTEHCDLAEARFHAAEKRRDETFAVVRDEAQLDFGAPIAVGCNLRREKGADDLARVQEHAAEVELWRLIELKRSTRRILRSAVDALAYTDPYEDSLSAAQALGYCRRTLEYIALDIVGEDMTNRGGVKDLEGSVAALVTERHPDLFMPPGGAE